jgi:hypothetical protein
MGKPDKVLRTRPLKELQWATLKLKKVALFHPDRIVVPVPSQYCVCRKEEHHKDVETKEMLQCEECWEWFHFGCVGLQDGTDVSALSWNCEWCRDKADNQGKQRWKTGRKKPKLRHVSDVPRLKGGVKGGNPPQQYSAPVSWEGKVAEIKEIARRAAIKKKKLTEDVEKLMGAGGHHLVDSEGLAGLQARPVDNLMIDDALDAGLVAVPEDEEKS